jgi:hypothetical protein
MDAPLYTPAGRFVPPVRQPRLLNTRDVAIADLMAIPGAWAVVLKEMPAISMTIGSPMLKPHLGNFSLHDLVAFGAAKGEALTRIDEGLRALGEVK